MYEQLHQNVQKSQHREPAPSTRALSSPATDARKFERSPSEHEVLLVDGRGARVDAERADREHLCAVHMVLVTSGGSLDLLAPEDSDLRLEHAQIRRDGEENVSKHQ